MSQVLNPPPGVIGEPVAKSDVKRIERVNIAVEHDGVTYNNRMYLFLRSPDKDGVYWDVIGHKELIELEDFLIAELGLKRKNHMPVKFPIQP